MIRISLSEAAGDKLEQAGETIRGVIYFDGDGTPLPGAKTAPHRDVILGHYDFELDAAGDIRISDATVSEEAHSRLSDTNYHFFINVYSARRVFKNNVLSGGYAAGRLSDLAEDKPLLIHLDLL